MATLEMFVPALCQVPPNIMAGASNDQIQHTLNRDSRLEKVKDNIGSLSLRVPYCTRRSTPPLSIVLASQRLPTSIKYRVILTRWAFWESPLSKSPTYFLSKTSDLPHGS